MTSAWRSPPTMMERYPGLGGATVENIRAECTSKKPSIALLENLSPGVTQACNRLSISAAARKSKSGGAVGHSSFRTGVSIGRHRQFLNGSRWSATWLDNTAQVETEVPVSEAWDLWSDRERVNRWMPWIYSVKILEDKPELSRWTLNYSAFGQAFEFSWIARNMKPTYHQKIHWRSVDGLPNRGTVRFYPRSTSACGVHLTISYEVPQVLAPLASALAPLVNNIIQQDLDRFAKFAKKNQLESQRK